jgi:hypothetical protein
MEEMKKEIERKDILRALENLFVSGYTHLKFYANGEVGLFMDANSDDIGADELLFHISLQELLEGFTEDSPMYPEDVKSLRTRNPEGVSFGNYLTTVADELYENLEAD